MEQIFHKIDFFKYTTISRKVCVGRQTTQVCNNTWKTLGIGMLGTHFPQVIGSKYG
jgi:hypothetical protein